MLNRLLITQRGNTTAFSVHNDDAPTVYVNGNPAQTDLVTRKLQHDLDALVATNPMTGNTDKLSKLLADQAEMKLLHMVTSSPGAHADLHNVRRRQLLFPERQRDQLRAGEQTASS